MFTHHRRPSYKGRIKGAVLPVALILLVVLTFAGISAAKRTTTTDLVAQNLRINEIAHQSAETALRYCEAVVMDMSDNGGAKFPIQATRVGKTAVESPETPTALWMQAANWAAASANRISAPVGYSASVRAEAQAIPPPQCIAEAMTNKRFLITARGHSPDATFSVNGNLLTGAEVWLQSILSPQIPL